MAGETTAAKLPCAGVQLCQVVWLVTLSTIPIWLKVSVTTWSGAA